MSPEIRLWIKKLFATVLFALLLYGLYISQSILSLLFIAGFLSILIIPLVDRLKKYKIPEWLTIILVYSGILLIAGIVIGTILPIVITYVSTIVGQVIQWSTEAQATYMRHGISGFHLPHWIESIVLYIITPENIDYILSIIKQNAGNIQTFITNQIGTITSSGITVVSTIGGAITNWVFIGMATFFMIIERKEIGIVLKNLLPGYANRYLDRSYPKIQNVCTSWIRASAILALSIGVMTYFGLFLTESIFGFKTNNIFALALISGIMEFIPYIGPILAVIPAAIVGLGIGWDATMIILILYIIIQQLENNILVPYIMSRNLDISPLFVFVIMLFGATLGWIMGIFLAVPVAGVLKVIYDEYVETHKKSPQYLPSWGTIHWDHIATDPPQKKWDTTRPKKDIPKKRIAQK